MKETLTFKAESIRNALLAFIAIILGGYVLYVGKSLLVPLLLAIFLTYLIVPILQIFRKFRFPVLLSALIFIGVFFAIILLFGYAINESFQEFLAAKDIYTLRLRELVESVDVSLFERFFRIKFDPSDILNSIVSNINFADFLSRGAGQFVDFVTTLGIVFFYLIFLLLEKGAIYEKIKKITSNKKSGSETMKAVELINQQIQRYIVLKTLISAATGLFVYAGLRLLEIDFAEIWAISAFFLNFIPSIGSIVATILPVVFAGVQYADPIKALIVLLVVGLIQMVIGNLIEPRIFGKQLNLSPLVVFFSLFLWGSMWGIIGMILSVPIMASISIITWHIPGLKPLSILMRER